MKEKVLKEFNSRKNIHLGISITLDILGMVTYLLPGLGEIGDIIFAPIYGLAIFIMYRRRIISAALGGVTGTIEELIPGVDVIPTATIMWIYTYIFGKDKTFKQFIKEKNRELDSLKELKA